MTERPASIRVLKGQEFHGSVLPEHRRKILGLAVHLGRQYLLCQAVAHLLHKIQNARPLLHLADAPVLHRDLQHFKNLLKKKNSLVP